MSKPASLTGVLTHTEYFDPESKFGLWYLLVDEVSPSLIAGVMQKPILGEEVTAYGAFEPHLKGNLLSFDRYYSRPPRSPKHLVQYLHSLSKVSLSEIQSLIKVFGEKTLDVIAFRPERLDEIGMSLESKEKLTKTWADAKDNELVVSLASEFGMSEKIWSKMRINYGAQVNFSNLIKKDPFTLYRVSDAISFQQILNLAQKLNVPKADICFVKGAVIALLRQQKVAHGNMLLERAHLANKIKNLINRPVNDAEVEEALKQLAVDVSLVDTDYLAFNDQIEVARNFWMFWASLVKRETTWEGAPTVNIAKKLLSDLPHENTLTDSELEEMCINLDKSFCTINFNSARQISAWIAACIRIWRYQGANVKIICHSPEAAGYLSKKLNVENIQHWSEAIILQEIGPPHFNRQNPFQCDMCIILQAEKFGVLELLNTLEAIPLNSAVHLWSVPTSIGNNSLGSPYLAATQLTGITKEHQWSDISPNVEFNPSENITFLPCTSTELPEAVCTIMEEYENTFQISAQLDVRVVLFSGELVAPLNEGITKRFYANAKEIEIENRTFHSDQPVIIREANYELAMPGYTLWNIKLADDHSVEFHAEGSKVWRYSPRTTLMVRSGIVLPVERAGDYWSTVVIVGIHEKDCISEDHIKCLLGMAPETIIFVGNVALLEQQVKSRIDQPRMPKAPKFMRNTNTEAQES